MTVTVWHNPGCGSSKNALAYLADKGIEPEIFLYLKEKPNADAITSLLEAMGAQPSDLLRPKDKLGEEMGLYAPGVSETAILEAMAVHAKLIQRPVVITPKGAVIARPKTAIDAIL